jgi:hypothetical protein
MGSFDSYTNFRSFSFSYRILSSFRLCMILANSPTSPFATAAPTSGCVVAISACR